MTAGFPRQLLRCKFVAQPWAALPLSPPLAHAFGNPCPPTKDNIAPASDVSSARAARLLQRVLPFAVPQSVLPDSMSLCTRCMSVVKRVASGTPALLGTDAHTSYIPRCTCHVQEKGGGRAFFHVHAGTHPWFAFKRLIHMLHAHAA